ncbi:hypothetical protein HanRHA438_Chr08g0347971 [Helianthus annuus]|uniref:Small heat shock protein HSP20 n=1 Tax=Helianthus annuus TaxID=4232 RepID=A0A9K3NCX5_HELAN|nr:putative small heat shock protein HSP20 [Helianthus annuus]KAJ0553341.1 putative Heat shock protein HSP14.7/HSP23.5/HSP23.6 [Helianthus annuus]KAJ0722250.1 putative Heat shock protein HSP14.7/HSP23.5/HSP23.6 [Helianthus annuus]KAJ0897647.1 hypothetical protein HanRHA438_Chr08g0347971 [Helianthus annuus]KAJ0901423.1 putative small heat shock protein HSP20 [Helianthus annuus]
MVLSLRYYIESKMASSLRLITSNLIKRSFRPTVVSASRFLSINRSYTTMPTDDSSVQSPIRLLCPKISSVSFEMDLDSRERSLTLKVPDQGLKINLDLPGLKLEDMRACAEHNTLFLQGKLLKEGDMSLPDQTSSEIKEERIPKKDDNIVNIIANDIIDSFCDITATRSWIYYDMFSDRSILGKGLCQVIATLSPINSFSIYKCVTRRGLEIKMSMPGRQKMKLTKQGLHVSLKMSELQREDIKLFFEYDTFFIEGKTKTEHYITGIHLPEGIQKKHNLIRRRMKHGIFYATLPCCVKKEELPGIKDQLKLT